MTIMCDRSLRVAQTVRPLIGDYNVGLVSLSHVGGVLFAPPRAEWGRLCSHDIRGDQERVSPGVHEAREKQAGVSLSRRRVVSGCEGTTHSGDHEDREL